MPRWEKIIKTHFVFHTLQIFRFQSLGSIAVEILSLRTRYGTPVTVAERLQCLACPLPTGRRWLGLVSNPCGSVGDVPDHA